MLGLQLGELEAVEAGLRASLAAVRRDLEAREWRLEGLARSGAPVARLGEVAAREARAHEEASRTSAAPASRREARARSVEADAASVAEEEDALAASLEEVEAEMWKLVDAGRERVVVVVQDTLFEASAASLRRSPRLARELSAAAAAAAPPAAAGPVLHLRRDAASFGAVLEYLRHGRASGHIFEGLPRAQRAQLLEEAAFFELDDLAGALAEPPVGASVVVRLQSARLAQRGIDAILLHEACGSWHAPGACVEPACRAGGAAACRGEVRGYAHGAEPLWTVECHGFLFGVPGLGLVPPTGLDGAAAGAVVC
ncbi:unnamed protein product [Prorocentrum cordatum]|uniref:Potassium channel tetramerisation-type BTB domain-containing protein n=1 Tax=Prorocentrum cordatum TaxID=2364126 RepID=A0ABN9WNJ0_9DINO|nr:unnamed protein product [Polarella glacialis]